MKKISSPAKSSQCRIVLTLNCGASGPTLSSLDPHIPYDRRRVELNLGPESCRTLHITSRHLELLLNVQI